MSHLKSLNPLRRYWAAWSYVAAALALTFSGRPSWGTTSATSARPLVTVGVWCDAKYSERGQRYLQKRLRRMGEEVLNVALPRKLYQQVCADKSCFDIALSSVREQPGKKDSQTSLQLLSAYVEEVGPHEHLLTVRIYDAFSKRISEQQAHCEDCSESTRFEQLAVQSSRLLNTVPETAAVAADDPAAGNPSPELKIPYEPTAEPGSPPALQNPPEPKSSPPPVTNVTSPPVPLVERKAPKLALPATETRRSFAVGILTGLTAGAGAITATVGILAAFNQGLCAVDRSGMSTESSTSSSIRVQSSPSCMGTSIGIPAGLMVVFGIADLITWQRQKPLKH